jgi:hypothetical protein
LQPKGQLAKNNTQPAERFTTFTDSLNSSHFTSRVDPVVIRSFFKTYEDVSDEKWLKVRNGFVAMFNRADINYQVAYDKKGNLVYTVETYSEEKMPKDLRHIVKSTYYDYSINLVQEIERPNDQLVYIIHLIGKTELIDLRVCDGEMEELRRFERSE